MRAFFRLRRSWKRAVGSVEPRLVAARPTTQAVAIVGLTMPSIVRPTLRPIAALPR